MKVMWVAWDTYVCSKEKKGSQLVQRPQHLNNGENGVVDDSRETVVSRHNKADAYELTETECARFV